MYSLPELSKKNNTETPKILIYYAWNRHARKIPGWQLIGCQPGRIAINRGIQILLLADDVAVEEGHDLAAGAGLREREFGLRGSLGDAVLHGPEDGLIEIVGTIRGRFLD